MDRGGQIKAMGIGLPGLALGPGASDTHWDAEGGGAPAAEAAVARGSGARERRGLGRGAQVTRRCRAGRPAGRRGSGARRGAAAAGHPRCRSAGPGNPPPPPRAGFPGEPLGLVGVRRDLPSPPSERAVGPGRSARPPRAGCVGARETRGGSPGGRRAEGLRGGGVPSRARPSRGAGAGPGALRCPGRAGRPSPRSPLCGAARRRERPGGTGPTQVDGTSAPSAHSETKDGLCLGGARRESGAVTPGPDSGRERGRGERAGGLGPTPPPRERAGSARGRGGRDGARRPDSGVRAC